MEKKPSSSSLVSKLIKGALAYVVLYIAILGFCPSAYRLYLQIYVDFEDKMPKDAPKQITEAKEMYGVHTYNEAKKHFGDEILIFRNFSNCAKMFDNIVYPRRKDQVDTYVGIDTIKGNPGNIYASGTRTTNKSVNKSLADLLDEASPDYYATFLRIFNSDDYRVMLNADNDTKFAYDSSFISHFKEPIVTTPIHSAPMAQTFSVQCYGTKSWLFHHVKDLRKHGFIPQANPHGVVINGSPESILKIPTVRAVVNPNDVMYFPPFYFHAVATTPGKNIMFAIRQSSLQSIKRSFKTSAKLSTMWIARYSFMQLWNKRKRRGFFVSDTYMPFRQEWVDLVLMKQKEAFQDYDGLDDFQLPAV